MSLPRLDPQRTFFETEQVFARLEKAAGAERFRSSLVPKLHLGTHLSPKLCFSEGPSALCAHATKSWTPRACTS